MSIQTLLIPSTRITDFSVSNPALFNIEIDSIIVDITVNPIMIELMDKMIFYYQMDAQTFDSSTDQEKIDAVFNYLGIEQSNYVGS